QERPGDLHAQTNALWERPCYGRRRTGWHRPEPAELAQLVRDSRLFDQAWYLSQVTDPVADPLEHFLTEGEVAGLSPHPAFLASCYLANLPWADRKQVAVQERPFTHYLTTGAARGVSTHPLFDAETYLAAYPRSGAVPGGPIADFLARGRPLTPAAGAS